MKSPQKQKNEISVPSSSTTMIMEEWNGSASTKLSKTALLTASPSSISLQRFDTRLNEFSRRILEAFVPEGFPSSVTPDYVPFQIWDSLQGLSTYIRTMLSTHALLSAIGVGEKSATVIGATFQFLECCVILNFMFILNYTVDSAQGILKFTMDVDMLSHFDEWQRSGKDDAYEVQDQWPLELRCARIIPAVDYLQAQRARGKLIREVHDSFTVDAFIGKATDWERVCMGNLVGMPLLVVPTGFKDIQDPPSEGALRRTAITTGIYAPPQRDHVALALAMAYQSVTDHHKQRPPIDELGPRDVIPNRPKSLFSPRR